MNTCFDILGVSPGISLADLKHTYFRLVRLHTPEKEPKLFAEIRKAYEEAVRATELDEPVFPVPDNPKEADLQFSRAESLNLDESYYMALFKDSVKKFPKNEFFLYYLIQYQLRYTNDSATLKNAEKLLKFNPGNRHYQMLCALCYFKKGQVKKALELAISIMEGGCRNYQFMTGYSNHYSNNQDWDEAFVLLRDLLAQNLSQDKKHLADLLSCCNQMISLAIRTRNIDTLNDGLSVATNFINKNYTLLDPEKVLEFANQLFDTSTLNADHETVSAIKNSIAQIAEHIPAGSVRTDFDNLLGEFEVQTIENDKRLPRCAAILYRAYVMTPELHPNAVKMDARLCALMEREALLNCRDILKDDYPDLYSKITPFLRQITTQDKADELKESLLEKYEDYGASYFPNKKRYYYDLYPDEMPEWMEDDDDDFDDDDDWFDDDDDDFDIWNLIFGGGRRNRGGRGQGRQRSLFDFDDDDDDDDDWDDDPFTNYLNDLRRSGAFPY